MTASRQRELYIALWSAGFLFGKDKFRNVETKA